MALVTWQDGAWVELEGCVADPDENTITAPVSHFSIYTVMAHTAPAKFEVAEMIVTPAEVDTGESVTIGVTVTNTGDLTGDYTIILKINGTDIQNKAIILKGGQSQVIEFKVTEAMGGEYTINIGGLTGSFTVKEPERQVAEPPTIETPELTPTPTPTLVPEPMDKTVATPQTEPEPEPTVQTPIEPVTDEGIAWWWIVIYVVAGVVGVGLGIFLSIWRRRIRSEND